MIHEPPHAVPPALDQVESDARDQERRADQKAQVLLALSGALIVALVALLGRDPSTPARVALWATGALLAPAITTLLAVVRSRLNGPLAAHGWVHIGLTGPSAALDTVRAAESGSYDQWLDRCARATTDVCVRALDRHRLVRRAVTWLYPALATLALALALTDVTR
uniref:hypothetical protein n=1 Tax=Saccharothrix espanaensis TaxID=103731 RepID=UPI003F491ACD